MPLTTVDLLTAAAILAAGSLLQGSIGFGLALVAAPFLILIDLLLLPGIMLGFAMSARCRKYIDRGLVRPAVLMVSAAAAVIVIVQAVGG